MSVAVARATRRRVRQVSEVLNRLKIKPGQRVAIHLDNLHQWPEIYLGIVSSGYTAVLDPERTKFIYRDSLWSGADLLGLGVASFSHVAGVHYQNLTEIDDYDAALDAALEAGMAVAQEGALAGIRFAYLRGSDGVVIELGDIGDAVRVGYVW